MQNARADTELPVVGTKDGVVYSKKKVIVVKSPSAEYGSAKYEPVKYKSSKYDPYKYGSSKYKPYKYRYAEYDEPYRYRSSRRGSYRSKSEPPIYNIYENYPQKHDSDKHVGKSDAKTINIDIQHSSEASAENNAGYGGYNYNNHNQFLPNYYQPYSGFPSYYNNFGDYGSE